jgi:hypothetical protein
MAKPKKKKISSSIPFKNFIIGNKILIGIALVFSLGTIIESARSLAVKEIVLYCNGSNFPTPTYDTDFFHSLDKKLLWGSALILVILSGLLIYRNKYFKRALIFSLVFLAIFWIYVQLAEGFSHGFDCLSF